MASSKFHRVYKEPIHRKELMEAIFSAAHHSKGSELKNAFSPRRHGGSARERQGSMDQHGTRARGPKVSCLITIR